MVKIKIGKYIIESNGRAYEVYKPVSPSLEAKSQKTGKSNVQYYTTMESVLKSLPERMAMTESNATTLSELLSEIKTYHLSIIMALQK